MFLSFCFSPSSTLYRRKRKLEKVKDGVFLGKCTIFILFLFTKQSNKIKPKVARRKDRTSKKSNNNNNNLHDP